MKPAAEVLYPVDQLIPALGYRATADLIGVEQTSLRKTYPGLSPKSNPGRRRRWDVTDEQILDLYDGGLRARAIARELGVSRHLVRCRLFATRGIGSNPQYRGTNSAEDVAPTS